ncbi:hypothetical protein BM1_07873 [Bipolaris maydis]|nr:hypothetical protein BM1_07873 [Bipolaris maydis]
MSGSSTYCWAPDNAGTGILPMIFPRGPSCPMTEVAQVPQRDFAAYRPEQRGSDQKERMTANLAQSRLSVMG